MMNVDASFDLTVRHAEIASCIPYDYFTPNLFPFKIGTIKYLVQISFKAKRLLSGHSTKPEIAIAFEESIALY